MSREVAAELTQFIPLVLQRANVVSPGDQIEKGQRWSDVLEDALASSDFGIACLTKDNINNPWLAFEVGKLSGRLGGSRFSPLLVDLSLADLIGPFATFQATTLAKSDMKRLLAAINMTSQVPVPDAIFDRSFESFWPDFERRVRLNLAGSPRSRQDEGVDIGEGGGELKKTIEQLLERVAKLEKDAAR